MKFFVCLFLISISFTAISQTWHKLFTEYNIPPSAVTGVCSDSNGDLWIATGSAGVFVYDGWSMVNYTTSDGLISNAIRVVVCDNAGKIWIGTTQGLSCWDNGQITNYSTQNGLQSQFVQSLAVGSGNVLWIGTNMGLIRFNGSSFIQYTINDGLPANSIRSLSFDGTYVWSGTLYGLSKFDGFTFQTFTASNGLPSGNIRAIWAESSNHIWIGTASGAAYYNGSSFQIFTTAQGLLSDSVFSISGDGSGIVWFGHGKSLSMYNGTNFTHFSETYLYPSSVINTIAVFDDDLCIGTDIEFLKTKKWVIDNPIEAFLETSKIRAYINNKSGILTWNPSGSPLALEFPKDSGTYTTFNSNLWLGGLDPQQNLHLAAGRYTEADFFPGPVQTSGIYDNTYDSLYNRLWVITKTEINNHIANWNQPGYQMPDAIQNWPSLSAPYQDMNGNYLYEPTLGDYPKIRGDKTILTVTNDIRLPHSTGGEPLKCELSTMYWVYDTANEAIAHTVFVHHLITNYNNYPFTNFYMGIQCDFDIGEPYSDYVGCDPSLSCFYTYNGSGNDGYYGTNIPAQGLVFLSSPLYSHLYYNNAGAGAMTDPVLPMDYYYNLHGYWKDGTPYTYGGNGYGGTNVTQYCFDGDPVAGTGWSEVSEGNDIGDRRSFGSVGPFTLNPGKGICIDYAFVTGRDSSGNNLLSVNKLKANIADVLQMYNSSSFYCDTININLPTNVDIEADNVNTCPGAAVELHPLVSGFNWPMTYTWLPATGLSDPSIVNPLATVNTTTLYTVTVTDALGNTDTDSVLVIIDPPQISLDSLYEMCAGGRIMLPQYTAYHWFNNNWTGRWYDFYSSGDYWVMVMDDFGCWSDTAFFSVDVIPAPEPELGPADTLCIGDITTVSPGPGYVSYIWNNGSTAGTIYVNANVLPVGNYLYSVTVTNSYGCEGSDSRLIMVIDCAFAENLSPDYPGFAYPNPFIDYIRIETGEGETGPFTMELFDATGRMVAVNKSDVPELSVPALSPGYYTLRFSSEIKTVNYRLVKTY